MDTWPGMGAVSTCVSRGYLGGTSPTRDFEQVCAKHVLYFLICHLV
jgi:hypothetical protein